MDDKMRELIRENFEIETEIVTSQKMTSNGFENVKTLKIRLIFEHEEICKSEIDL